MGPRTHEQRLAVGIWSQPKQHRDSCCDSCLTVHPLIRNKPVFAPAARPLLGSARSQSTWTKVGQPEMWAALANCAWITGYSYIGEKLAFCPDCRPYAQNSKEGS